MNPFLQTSLYFTAAGIVAYWVTIFTGFFPVEERVPGYRIWFMSFPVADFWIAFASILAAAVAPFNKPLSAIAMAAAGSGLMFLGLYAFAYGFNTGLVNDLTIDELIEIGIKLYCLVTGGWLIVTAYLQVAVPRGGPLANTRPRQGDTGNSPLVNEHCAPEAPFPIRAHPPHSPRSSIQGESSRHFPSKMILAFCK